MQGRTTLSPSPQFSCARLQSTSPPDSAYSALRLSPTSSTRTTPYEPAVLNVSEVVYVPHVQRSVSYTPTETTPLLSSSSQPAAQLPNTGSAASLVDSHDRGGTGADQGASSETVQRCSTCSKIALRLSQMVFGGVIIAVSWLSVDRHELSFTRCHNAQCCQTAFRLQMALLSQGLLLLLTGALLLCWNLTALLCFSRDSNTLRSRLHTCLAFTWDVCSYALLVSSLVYTAWQILSSSVHCQWPLYVYVALTVEEILAVLLLSCSVGVVCIACRNAYCN